MDWLFKQDDYIPKEDKDGFINKSMFSLLRVLSEIKRNNGSYSSRIHRINPQLKLVSTFLTVTLISSSKDFKFLGITYVYLFIISTQLRKEEIKKILSLNLIIPIFTLIALIPSIILGNIYSSLMIIVKVLATILVTSILSYTTKWSDITKSLRLLYIPNIFILIMEITIRYIFILGEFSFELFNSLLLKSVGKNANKYTSLSSLIGTLFMKSKYMGDELYSAMECRGFQGEYVCNLKYKLISIDYVFVLLNAILILAFIIFSKV